MTRPRLPSPTDGLFYDVVRWIEALEEHFSICPICPRARQWRSFCLTARRNLLSFATWRASR